MFFYARTPESIILVVVVIIVVFVVRYVQVFDASSKEMTNLTQKKFQCLYMSLLVRLTMRLSVYIRMYVRTHVYTYGMFVAITKASHMVFNFQHT